MAICLVLYPHFPGWERTVLLLDNKYSLMRKFVVFLICRSKKWPGIILVTVTGLLLVVEGG